jgi:stearoyl-CoA desaturase (delta-9 desaturase)
MGEGWHNYHHVFPWDYKSAELGGYTFNVTTGLIDFFSLLGWAYDLRAPTVEMVRRAVERSGDGSHTQWKSTFKDDDVSEEAEGGESQNW